MVVRWALTIFHKSSSAYSYIRRSGFLQLPHENTLRTYIWVRDLSCGIDYDYLKILCEDERVTGDAALLPDNLKIKDELV